MRKPFFLLFLFVTFILSGCEPAGTVPTLIPTALPVEVAVTNTPDLPPTRTPLPTATLPPTATAVFATQTPTPIVLPDGPTVNLTTPPVNASLVMGTDVSVGGLAQILPGQTLSVTLVSATGHRLTAAEAAMDDINAWQVTLPIPQQVSGPALLQAAILDENNEPVSVDVQAVQLVLDTTKTEKYMALFRPILAEKAVGGFNLFFDGRAQQPTGNYIRISVWDQNCRNRVAVQGFQLRGSTYWRGFLVVPRDVSGQVCAVADFGEPGDPDWREAQTVIEILPPDDPQAKGVMVGNPPPNATLNAGQSTLLYGTAYNAPDSLVVISVLLENGRVLTETVTQADFFGYWEESLFIPADAEGPAFINVSIGTPNEDDYAQNQTEITIQ